MNGEEVHLCIGGVRSLNEENLYGKKSLKNLKSLSDGESGYAAILC